MQNRNPQNVKLPTNKDFSSIIIDSIVFKTSNENFVYLTERLYPAIELSDSMAIRELILSDILSVEKTGDTIFVFMNNDLLYNQLNQNLPPINDSLFEHFYPKYYNVIIDDDIPYIVNMKNEKDNIQIIKSKKGIFYWEKVIVKDTIFSFLNDIKVGMHRDEVFKRLKLPKLDFDKDHFSLILCHASIPSNIWYKTVLNSKEQLKSIGYDNYDLTPERSTLQVLLHFTEGYIDYMYLDPWIGY